MIAGEDRSRTELEGLSELAAGNGVISETIVTRLEKILARIKGATPHKDSEEKAAPDAGTLGVLSGNLHETQENLSRAEDVLSRIEPLI